MRSCTLSTGPGTGSGMWEGEFPERCTPGFGNGWGNPGRGICILFPRRSTSNYVVKLLCHPVLSEEGVRIFSWKSLLPVSSLQPGWQGLMLGPTCHLLAGGTVMFHWRSAATDFASFPSLLFPLPLSQPPFWWGISPSPLHLRVKTLVSAGTVTETDCVHTASLRPAVLLR